MMTFWLIWIAVCVLMLIRIVLVDRKMSAFIQFYYDEDNVTGWSATEKRLPVTFEQMMWRFWVWDFDSFYPAYKRRNK